MISTANSIFFVFDLGFAIFFPLIFLICIFINETLKNCQEQNLNVKSNAPVFNIIKVTINTFPDGCISPVTVYLSPSGRT